MFKIIRTYKEKIPALRLIGLTYYDKDRNKYGAFSNQWEEWFQTQRFETLKNYEPLFENDYIGGMRINNGVFEYWIGMLFSADASVPQGFEYVDIDEGFWGVNWVYGSEQSGELYGLDVHNACVKKLKEYNWKPADSWFLERYNCPRFSLPDEYGNVILDYCIYLAD